MADGAGPSAFRSNGPALQDRSLVCEPQLKLPWAPSVGSVRGLERWDHTGSACHQPLCAGAPVQLPGSHCPVQTEHRASARGSTLIAPGDL